MGYDVTVDNDKCDGCGSCIESCPVEAIKIENDKAVINEECVDCGACLSACPKEAISLP